MTPGDFVGESWVLNLLAVFVLGALHLAIVALNEL